MLDHFVLELSKMLLCTTMSCTIACVCKVVNNISSTMHTGIIVIVTTIMGLAQAPPIIRNDLNEPE